jgi:hypothetical protein
MMNGMVMTVMEDSRQAIFSHKGLSRPFLQSPQQPGNPQLPLAVRANYFDALKDSRFSRASRGKSEIGHPKFKQMDSIDSNQSQRLVKNSKSQCSQVNCKSKFYKENKNENKTHKQVEEDEYKIDSSFELNEPSTPVLREEVKMPQEDINKFDAVMP